MDTNQYVEKLKELVYDEDRIVTCVSIADILGISIEDSKLLLKKFIEDQRQKKSHELSVSYLLSGITQNGSGPLFTVTVVKEEDLKGRKAQFERAISEIPYSIQKANNIDFNIIAQIEKTRPDNPEAESIIGSVIGKNCIKRTLRQRTLPVPTSTQQQSSKTKRSFFTKIESKPEVKTEIKTEKEEKTTKDNTAKSMQDVKVKNKGGITNFFTKGATKAVENEKTSRNEPAENRGGKKTSDKKEGDKKTSNKKEGEKKTDSKSNKNDPTIVDAEEKMEVDILEDNEEKKVPAVKRKETPNLARKNEKKRPNKEKNDQPNKKRKRIVQRDDSDSDDMFGGEDDNYEDIIEQSMEEEREPPPIQKLPKNKIRKAVDKTYEDEEGYIVTRTEYVYETPSDNETDEIIKPPKKPHPKTPASEEKKKSVGALDDASPVNNKGPKTKKGKKAPAANQPTLMNFFKKK